MVWTWEENGRIDGHLLSKGLSHGGINIRDVEDSLLWLYDKDSGKVWENIAYDLIISDYLPPPSDCIIS